MSYYVAFPAHLLPELLALLPSDERPVYGERFERIAGDLVWVREDADNAVLAALQNEEAQEASVWQLDAAVRQELTERLMDVDNDALVALVQEGLAAMASTLVTERLRARQTGSSPAPETSGQAV
jgi:hypothetical protein